MLTPWRGLLAPLFLMGALGTLRFAAAFERPPFPEDFARLCRFLDLPNTKEAGEGVHFDQALVKYFELLSWIHGRQNDPHSRGIGHQYPEGAQSRG